MTRARDIAHALGGRRAQRLADGGFLVPCPVPSHGKGRGDRSPSLRIGDGATRVLVHCYAGCDPRDVLDALQRRGLLDGKCEVSAHLLNADRGSISKPSDPDAYAREQHRKASWLWSHRTPIAGTIVETYLRARGITGPLPATLGYLPARKPGHQPAMIAAFGLADEIAPGLLAAPRDVIAVHLTLLRADGTGKADVRPNKLMIASPGNLPIVLAPPNDLGRLAVTEGIEDGLSVAQSVGLGVWCAASAGRMPALAALVPSCVETVVIFAHDDAAGQDGAGKLATTLAARGVETFIEGLSS